MSSDGPKSGDLRQFCVERGADITPADFRIVKAALGHRVRKPAGDVGGDVRITITATAAEQQIELLPMGQIPGTADHWADHRMGHAGVTHQLEIGLKIGGKKREILLIFAKVGGRAGDVDWRRDHRRRDVVG